MSKCNHRAQIVTRDDYNNPWSLNIWRNPSIKKRIMKCAICHPKHNPRKNRAIRKFNNQLMKED